MAISNFLTGLGKNQTQDLEFNQLRYSYTFMCYLLLRRASLYYRPSSLFHLWPWPLTHLHIFSTGFLRNYSTDKIFIARQRSYSIPFENSQVSVTRKIMEKSKEQIIFPFLYHRTQSLHSHLPPISHLFFNHLPACWGSLGYDPDSLSFRTLESLGTSVSITI